MCQDSVWLYETLPNHWDFPMFMPNSLAKPTKGVLGSRIPEKGQALSKSGCLIQCLPTVYNMLQSNKTVYKCSKKVASQRHV